MSAQPLPHAREVDSPWLGPMQLSDVGEVAAIEKTIYSAPWTEGNFLDSLRAGYCAWTLRAHETLPAPEQSAGTIIGYLVLMPAVDEAHLLNISVAASAHAQGHGLRLLHHARMLALEHNASSLILEVRPSNLRAVAIYRRFGFVPHGLRRRYYPASTDDQNAREDAIVMRLAL